MALRRLTSLEAGKLQEEAATLATGIAGLTALLADPQLVLDTVKRESQEVADKHGNERRTAVSIPLQLPFCAHNSAVMSAWRATCPRHDMLLLAFWGCQPMRFHTLLCVIEEHATDRTDSSGPDNAIGLQHALSPRWRQMHSLPGTCSPV